MICQQALVLAGQGYSYGLSRDSLPCAGRARILREVERRLGIKLGETTDDLEYTLETVACIGACALAPTMRVEKETYGQMTTKKVVEVFGDRGKAE